MKRYCKTPAKGKHSGMSLVSQANETIQRFGMIVPQDRVLVAVSGGPDSMALFDILANLAARLKIELAIAHLNHGIRPAEAQREEAFVHRLAQNHQIPYYMDRIRLDKDQGSLEERARQARYAFLTQTARSRGYSKIALGHQADDNAEALLMHLLRGSGTRGLGGIPPVRDHWIVRPLLELRRLQILAYLKDRRIDYVQDASNEDTRFLRNRVRHQLLPHLEQIFNTDPVAALNRTAAICRDEEAWFQSYLAPLLTSIQAPSTKNSLLLRLGPLAEAHPALQRRLIREALRRWQGHLQRLTAAHVEDLIRLVSLGTPSRRLVLPGGLMAQGLRDHLRLTFTKDDTSAPGAPQWAYAHTIRSKAELPIEIRIGAGQGVLRFALCPVPDAIEFTRRQADIVWLDVARLSFPLTIRNWQTGDRIRPLGINGTQKLKKLFCDNKIPRQNRFQIPLLISDNKVLWVAGVRRGAEALVGNNTREVLRVAWSPTSHPE